MTTITYHNTCDLACDKISAPVYVRIIMSVFLSTVFVLKWKQNVIYIYGHISTYGQHNCSTEHTSKSKIVRNGP